MPHPRDIDTGSPRTDDATLNQVLQLAKFGLFVLRRLDEVDSWSADDFDAFQEQAFLRDLADADGEGMFRALVSPELGYVALEQALGLPDKAER